MAKKKFYLGVSRNPDSNWQFTVQKANGKWNIGIGYSIAKVAALMRDEYILRQKLDWKRNFPPGAWQKCVMKPTNRCLVR